MSLACTLAIFCQDGQEILGLKDVQSIYDRSLQEGGQKKAHRKQLGECINCQHARSLKTSELKLLKVFKVIFVYLETIW